MRKIIDLLSEKNLINVQRHTKRVRGNPSNPLVLCGSPNGNRTRVFGVRGRYPEPLDDGTLNLQILLYVDR